MQLFFSFVFSFLCSLGLTWLIRRNAVFFGFIDRPGAHKQHADLTPTLGGIAIFGALLFSSLLYPMSSKTWVLLQASALVTVVGAVDDIRGVRATHKLFVLALAACVLCEGNWPTGGPFQFPLNWILSFLWVGLVSSAFNGVDNADGAAGGLICISSLLCLLVGWVSGARHFESLMTSVALAGACLGFLIFNFPNPRASIFLGDSGSLLIGLVISCLALDVVPQLDWWSFFFAGTLFAVPLFDFGLILILRGIKGQYSRWTDPITMCARDHTFHRLRAFGLTPRAAIYCMYLVALAIGLGATLSWSILAQTGLEYYVYWVSLLAISGLVVLNQAPLAQDVYAEHRSVR